MTTKHARPPMCLVMTRNACQFCDACSDIREYHYGDMNNGWLFCGKCVDALEESVAANYKFRKEFDIRKFKTLFPSIDTTINYSVRRTSGEIQSDWILSNGQIEPMVHLINKDKYQTRTYEQDSTIVIWLTRASSSSTKAIRLTEFYELNADKLKIPIEEFRRQVFSVIL